MPAEHKREGRGETSEGEREEGKREERLEGGNEDEGGKEKREPVCLSACHPQYGLRGWVRQRYDRRPLLSAERERGKRSQRQMFFNSSPSRTQVLRHNASPRLQTLGSCFPYDI